MLNIIFLLQAAAKKYIFFVPEFVYLHAVVRDMSQIQALEPLRVAVEVVTLDAGGGLLEADVVEPGEAGTVDILDCVVRDQEVLLPPHEHVVRLLQLLIVETIRIEVLGVLVEGKKFALKSGKIEIEPKILIFLDSPSVSCPHPHQRPTFL